MVIISIYYYQQSFKLYLYVLEHNTNIMSVHFTDDLTHFFTKYYFIKTVLFVIQS